MRNIFYLAIIILMAVCTALINPNKPKKTTDWEKHKLKGKVKQYVEKIYYYDTKNTKTLGSYKECNYNEKGYLIKDSSKSYHEKDLLNHNPLSIRKTYEYDTSNNIVKMFYLSEISSHEKNYKYNKDGKLSEEIKMNKNLFYEETYKDKKSKALYNSNINDTTFYKYDDKGRLIFRKKNYDTSEYKYDNNNNLIEETGANHILYRYDNKNRMVEKNVFNWEEIIYAKTYYKHDAKDSLIEATTYVRDFSSENKDTTANIKYKISYKVTYRYNNAGYKIEKTENYYDKVIPVKCTYKYEFDKVGNIIKIYKIYSNTSYLVTEYQIEYYK